MSTKLSAATTKLTKTAASKTNKGPVAQALKATDMSVEEWRDYRYRCPIEATLDIIGGRWKGIILFHLLDGKKRFSEFRRLFPAMTQRSLTIQLRELERDGVIHREVYAQVPPKVEYWLTEHGRSLEPILLSMSAWGEHYTGPKQGSCTTNETR